MDASGYPRLPIRPQTQVGKSGEQRQDLAKYAIATVKKLNGYRGLPRAVPELGFPSPVEVGHGIAEGLLVKEAQGASVECDDPNSIFDAYAHCSRAV